jgi:hypothetical protein
MKRILAVFLSGVIGLLSSRASEPMVIGDSVAIEAKVTTSRWKPVWKDLDDWVRRVKRPGWSLIHKSSAEGYHFAVFADGRRAVALVVHRWREKEPDESSQMGLAGKGFKMDWSQTRDLIRAYSLNSHGATDGGAGFGTIQNEAKYEEKEGTWIPLPDGYRGPVQVLYQVTRRGGAKPVLQIAFAWPPDQS